MRELRTRRLSAKKMPERKSSEAYKAICQEVGRIRKFMQTEEMPKGNRVAMSATLATDSTDVVRCLEALQYAGKCQIVILADSEAQSIAETDLESKTVSVTENIYNLAYAGDPEAKFILAHEIGHLMLHDGKGKAAYTKDMQSPREHEASFFASRLLTKKELNGIAEAQLTEAQLAEAQLAEAQLTEAQLTEAQLTKDTAQLFEYYESLYSKLTDARVMA